MDREQRHGEWSIGGLFVHSTAIVIANPAATLIPAFLLGTLPGSFLGYAVERTETIPAEELGYVGAVGLVVGWIGFGIVLDVLLQGLAVPVAIAHAEGRRVGLGVVLRSTAPRLPVLAALGLLVAVATMAGLTLLLVPGLILYAAWSVAGGAVVAERLGPIAALRRSWRLTTGVRLKVAGFRLVTTGLYFAWVLVESAAGLVLFQGVDALTSSESEPFPVGYWLATAVPQTLVLAWWGAAHGRLYIDLRDAADGPPAARLAAIFG